jgi:DNA-3-methyladenine glycosylase II
MKAIIKAVGPCTLTPNPADPFTLLVRAVIGQQISSKAAASIFGKLAALVGGPPVPLAKVSQLTDEQLKACGVSGPKQRTLRAVIEHVQANPTFLPGIEERDNDTIHEQLTQIKGIGPWSADMFLIFGLGRPDVLAVGDYGLKVGLKRAFNLKELPKPAEAAALTEHWRPYRSVATWYLWRSLELPGGEK